jgi:Flp pilus assembly protein TadB
VIRVSSWWDHFLAEAVPTAIIAAISAAALAVAAWALVAILGAQLERQRRRRSRARRLAAYEQQLQITVPMLSAAAQEADR